MTNTIISVTFCAILSTNIVDIPPQPFNPERYIRSYCYELDKRESKQYTILSNWCANVNIDGKTNTIVLDTSTNSQWTVDSMWVYVSRTNVNIYIDIPVLTNGIKFRH